jgi:hypothetical protein
MPIASRGRAALATRTRWRGGVAHRTGFEDRLPSPARSDVATVLPRRRIEIFTVTLRTPDTVDRVHAAETFLMSQNTIHVEPDHRGSWLVRHEAERVSEHQTATDAERAAVQAARRFSATSVLLHDRYRRVREVSLLGQRAQ